MTRPGGRPRRSAQPLRQVCAVGLTIAAAGLMPGHLQAQTADAPARPSPATAAASPVAAIPETGRAVRYRLDIQAPAPLDRLLATQLDLARFQQASADDAITALELDRLVAAAPAQARALLRTAGYFSAQVKVERLPPEAPTPDGAANAAGDAAVDAQTAALPRVRVDVQPGSQTRVALWNLTAEGEFETLREQDDAESIATWVTLLRDWPLRPGDPFTQDGWDATKSTVLATLRARGYPQATLRSSRAEVDSASATAGLSIRATSGPLYRLGDVRVEGLSRYRAPAVLNLVDFGRGAPYTEKRLLDLQERIGKIGLFDGVNVTLEPDADGDAVSDVLVRVREAPMQQATFGAGVSANTGPRLTLEHTHRRVFGQEWILRNKGQLGRDERNWEGEALSHPLKGGYRALISGKVQWLDAGESILQSAQVRAGASLDGERIERLVFAELLQDEVRTAAGSQLASAVSGNYNLVWRALDSVLLPTLGETANMQAGLGYALSSTAPTGPFVRAYGRFTAYRPVGERWYFTGRLELGHLQAGEGVAIPETLRFRAGGDESVRGYAYRSLGPEDAAGVVASGRMLATVSVEMARPVMPSLPAVWGAVFLDAGNAANTWRALKPVYGLGVGVRWRSPVGPLRVDLAYGEAVRRLRLHVSVGIAF